MPTKVLAFHHVSASPRLHVGPDIDVRVTPDQLRRCLEEHADWARVDYRRGLDPDAAAGRSLLITFDDGYADNLGEALPILEELDAPCIIFVVPGYLDGTVRPVESDVAWLAAQSREGDAQRAFYERVTRRLRRLDPRQQHDEIMMLGDRLGLGAPPPMSDVFLTWDQVVALHEHPLVTIGSHTMNHVPLGWSRVRRARDEVTASKKRLEQVLGATVECFAYPYGRHNVVTRRMVAEAGYRWGFTTGGRIIADVAGIDPMAVPRFCADAGEAAGAMRGAA